MEGYTVLTSDDHKVGHVVAIQGDYLVIEHGTFRKSKHALPRTFAHADDEGRCVRISVPKDMFEEGPKLGDDGSVDEDAVAAYFGLAGGIAGPETEGYGDLDPDEAGISAEVQAGRLGIETAGQERLRVRKEMRTEAIDPASSSPGRQIHPDRREYRGK